MTSPFDAKMARPSTHRDPAIGVALLRAADVAAMDQVIPANRAHLETFLPWAREEPISTEQRSGLVERFRADFKAGTDFTLGIFTAPTASSSEVPACTA